MRDPLSLLPVKIRKSYFRQFATVTVLIVIGILAVSLFFQGQVSAELHHEKHTELETVAQLEADQLSQWVRSREDEVRMLSEFQSIKTGDSDQIEPTLDNELEKLPATVHSIHYINVESKKIRASTTDSVVGSSIAKLNLKWAHGSLEFTDASEVAVSEGYQRNGNELIAFVSPVGDSDYAIMMTVDVSARADHFKKPIKGSFTQVVNSEGVVEFAQQQNHALKDYSYSSQALQQAQNGETGALEMSNEDLVVGYAPVEGTDWAVMIHAPQSEAYAIASTVRTDFIILSGIALLGFVVLGLTIGRTTVQTLNRLTTKANRLEAGEFDTSLETERHDELGSLFEAFASMRDSLQNRIQESQQAREQAEQAQEEVQALNKSLESKAADYSKTMSLAADGDLSQRMEPESESDAMTEIGHAFNSMMNEIEDTITRVKDFATDVADSSQTVTASTEEVQSASEQVSESIQEISAGAEQQTDNLTEVSGEVQNLSGTIEEVASSTDQVATTAQQAAQLGQAGSESASEAIDEMTAIESKTDETMSEVESLAAEMDEIGEIVELIREITEQTNLLALNASIEAARAGEAGEGFAVVADEIKSLATEAAEATEQIESLITDIQSSTGETVEDMREMSDRLSGGMETIEDALTALDEIADEVEEASSGIQEISAATDDQAASTEEVAGMIDEVASVAEQTSEEASNVSAAAEEQTSSLTEVSENVQSLSQRADELQGMLAEFTVSGRSVGTVSEAGGRPEATADGGRPDRTTGEE